MHLQGHLTSFPSRTRFPCVFQCVFSLVGLTPPFLRVPVRRDVPEAASTPRTWISLLFVSNMLPLVLACTTLGLRMASLFGFDGNVILSVSEGARSRFLRSLPSAIRTCVTSAKSRTPRFTATPKTILARHCDVEGCVDRWNNDQQLRCKMMEHIRLFETMAEWEKDRSGIFRTPLVVGPNHRRRRRSRRGSPRDFSWSCSQQRQSCVATTTFLRRGNAQWRLLPSHNEADVHPRIGNPDKGLNIR